MQFGFYEQYDYHGITLSIIGLVGLWKDMARLWCKDFGGDLFFLHFKTFSTREFRLYIIYIFHN